MERLTLNAPVDIRGKDFWDRKVSVRLEPAEKRGWFWQVGTRDVLIDPKVLNRKTNRVQLKYGRAELNVFEHLGPLRFMGLDGIRIVTKNRWLPYDGSAAIFYDAVLPHLKRDGELVVYAPKGTYQVQHGDRRLPRSVTFMPHKDPSRNNELHLEVEINYQDLGAYKTQWTFPNPNFATVARSKTQGWPPSRRRIADFAGFFGWSHTNAVVWPQDHPRDVTLALFARHRVLDILGTFSALCPLGGILAGRIVSKYAGHKQDVELVKRAHLTYLLSDDLFVNRTPLKLVP